MWLFVARQFDAAFRLRGKFFDSGVALVAKTDMKLIQAVIMDTGMDLLSQEGANLVGLGAIGVKSHHEKVSWLQHLRQFRGGAG